MIRPFKDLKQVESNFQSAIVSSD